MIDKISKKINKIVINFLLKKAQKKPALWYRLVNLIMTVGLIFICLPAFYYYSACYLLACASGSDIIIANLKNLNLINLVADLAILLGTGLIIWTLILQYKFGEGSGSHLVPTQKLLVSGPYKIVRHPMLLGAILFYFGIGAILVSFMVGLYSALITAISAYFFVVYIEEPVLIARFGEQYQAYQQTVPLLPRLFHCFNNGNRKHKTSNRS